MNKKNEEALDIEDIELPEASLDQFGLDGSDMKSQDRNAVREAMERIKTFIPKVEMVPIDQIKDYANNPRINDAAVAPVKESIRRFGMNVPLTIDKDNVIATGHTRLKACRELGIEMVPCIRLDRLSPEEIQAWRLVDNKTNEFASWDWDKLSLELKEVVDNGIDLSIFDFQLKDETKNLDDPELDEIPESDEVPFTQNGDLWILGNHRIYCGDSTNQKDVAVLMDGKLADLVVTDPPYNVSIGITSMEEAKIRKRRMDGLTIKNDEMTSDDFRDFLAKCFECMDLFMRNGASYYIWYASSESYNFIGEATEKLGQVRQILVWDKGRIILGRQDYQWQHEPCLYGWKDGAGHYFTDDRTQSTVLKFAKPTKSDLHPTMKPVKLIAQLVANSSKIGEIVLDMFGGSGTTMIACEELGRQSRTMELDPRYVDSEVIRFINLKKGNEERVRLIRGGEETPFDELRARADENRKAK